MRRNHISGKMKRILAVACAAAVVLTSVPGGSFAYADEVTNEEAGLSETAEENAEAADAATTENAAETEEQVSTEESGTAETASVQQQEEAPAKEEEAPAKEEEAPAKEEAPASDTAEPAKTENAEDNTQAPEDQGKETVQESKPAEKANDASGETAPKTDTNKDNADEKKAPTVKKTTPAKKTEPKEAMKAGDSKEEEYKAEITLDANGKIYMGDEVGFSVKVTNKEGEVVPAENYEVTWEVGTATFGSEATPSKTIPGDEPLCFKSGCSAALKATIKMSGSEEVAATSTKSFDVYSYSGHSYLPEGGSSLVKCGEELKLGVTVTDAEDNEKEVDAANISWEVSRDNTVIESMGGTGEIYAFTTSEPGMYTVKATVTFCAEHDAKIGISTFIKVVPVYTLEYYDNVDDPDGTPSKKVEGYGDGEDLLSAEGAGVSNGNYSFAGWSMTKNTSASGLYYKVGEKWYNDGNEFKGFGIEDDTVKTVKLYAQWTDTVAPEIDIKIKEIQFSSSTTTYTQDEVTVTDKESGIGTISYGIGSIDTAPTSWKTVTFGTDGEGNPTKEKYTFPVEVPAKGVLWVKAEDNAEQVITVGEDNKVNISNEANTASEKGFSLVFENNPPEITSLTSEWKEGNFTVDIVATDKPDAQFSGIQSIDYELYGVKEDNTKEKITGPDFASGTIKNNESPTSVNDIQQTFEGSLEFSLDQLKQLMPKEKEYAGLCIKAKAKDFCGNEPGDGEEVEKTFKVDTKAPAITVELIKDGKQVDPADPDLDFYYVNGDDGDSIKVKLEDELSAIDSAEITVGGITYPIEDTEEYTIQLSDSKFAGLTEGEITVTAKAKDIAGNEATTFKSVGFKEGGNNVESALFVLDKTAPSSKITLNNTGGETYYVNGDSDTITGVFEDSVSGIAKQEVILSGDTTVYKAAAAESINLKEVHSPEGEVTVTVNVTDKAGNSASAFKCKGFKQDGDSVQSAVFMLDKHAPVAEITLIKDGKPADPADPDPYYYYVNGKDDSLTVIIKDAVSGIKTHKVTLSNDKDYGGSVDTIGITEIKGEDVDIDLSKISRPDGEVIVTVETTDYAGNSTTDFKRSSFKEDDGTAKNATFVFDTVNPLLKSVESDPEKDFYKDGSLYYISSTTVKDTYTIEDVNPGTTTVTYTKDGTAVPNAPRGTTTVVVEMRGDGVYKDFTVTGTDKAGNAIIVSEALGKGTVNEVLVPAAGKPITLTYGKVLDTKPPVLTSVTSSVASGKKFYDGKDRLWYVSSNTVTDTYTINDTNLSTTTVSYTDKGTTKEATGTSTITVKMSGDGVYKGFTVTGTDKAGNKIITEQKLNDGKVNEVPKTESPIALPYGKVLDVTAPTVKFTTTKRSYADSLEGSRRYFRDTFTGTFTVADNFTLDNSKISSHIYRAEESEKYYNKLKAFKEESTIDPDKDQAKTIIYTGEVTADGSHSADGNYRFFIEGTDKAGNKIVVDKAQPASGEFALQESSSGKGTGFRSNDKVLDTVAPRAVMKVVNDKDKSFYTLDMSPSNYKLSDFDPYQKKIASKVKVTTDDKSPVDIAYDIVSTVKEGNKPGQYAGYGNDVSSTTSIPARRQIITINDLVIRDRAGNVLALSGDPNNENVPLMDKKTLYLSNKLIFDDKAPTTKPNDIVAPSATVKASGSITHRNADGRDLFNGARTLTVTITDEGGQVYSSGLKNVSYDVYVDGKKVAGDAKTYSEIGASKALNEKTASIKDDSLTYTKKFSIKLTTAYQSNDIEVRVNAEDHSGNKMQTVKYRCGIDSVGPKITVSYDNNSAQNEKYFKADRTATITVIDRNVDNGKIPIRTEVSVPGSFSWSSGGGNGANDRWVKRLGYNTDGDYTLQLGNCTDALGNKASITYEGTAPNAFTIDKTVPVISVTFDNNSFQNGKYYKDPRTATVTIQEHNFRGSDVQISQTGDAASAGGFNEGGDSHSATIYYGTDGDYSFNVNYTDLAGNPAQVVTVDEFTVDLTPPVVRFIEPDESKVNKSGLIAYTGDIAPEIFYSDKNITKGMAVITLNGAKANHSLDPVEDLFDGFEGTVRFGNLAKVRENDDIYTAIATVTDLAGNETPVTVIFSVNRFGSTFDYNKNEYTEGMIKTYYTNDAKDMILREINVNELESYTVTLYRDGENRKLVEGTDFKVEKKQVNGHYEYIYTIFASNFAEEGNYNVVVTSKDKAGNTNTNSSVRGDDGSNEVPLRFAVDKTAPTNLITGVDLTKNRFRESGLNLTIQPMDNMNAVASFHVRVTDSDGKVLFEQILTDKELAAFFQDQDGIYNLPIEQNTKWQTVEVVTTDAAGNVSTDYTVENNTAYNVLVTPNVFYQYINSKPMLGGTAALIALLIFLIAMKRKKDNDQAAA